MACYCMIPVSHKCVDAQKHMNICIFERGTNDEYSPEFRDRIMRGRRRRAEKMSENLIWLLQGITGRFLELMGQFYVLTSERCINLYR